MQTLGLSDSTPKPEGRIKALFWPQIRHEYDADYIAQQGFWICCILATLTLVVGVGLARNPVTLVDTCYLLLGAAGIRQRSKFAAVAVFVNYLLTVVATGPGVASIIFLGLLLSNIRGTWLAARWRANATEPPPLLQVGSLSERISNRFAPAIWPIGRWVFYPLAVLEVSALLWTFVQRSSVTPG